MTRREPHTLTALLHAEALAELARLAADKERLRDALDQAHERLEACLTHAADPERVAIEAFFGMCECAKTLRDRRALA